MSVLNLITSSTRLVFNCGRLSESFLDLVRTTYATNAPFGYLGIALSSYSSYLLIKNFIWWPLYTIAFYFWNKRGSLKSLLKTYGNGLVIITGAVSSLGPAYCRKLLNAGFSDFLLLDVEDKIEKLETLKK